MNLTFTGILIQAGSALIIAIFSSWFTVRLSKDKFRAERLWERNVLAYERVIEEFYKYKKFSIENLAAANIGSDLPKDRSNELLQFAKEAREEIRKSADIGSFTLSEEAIKILERYEVASNDINHLTTWQEHLEHHHMVTDIFMKHFIAEAKKDLKR